MSLRRATAALVALAILEGVLMPAFVPSTPAPTHPGRFRATPLPLAGVGAGGDFLTDVFPNGRQSIEFAFGADLSADFNTWSWVDLTPRGQWDPGVTISPMGASDEADSTQPAGMTLDLLDPDENLVVGNAHSIYWPNVKENTPVRARLDIGNGLSTRFFGYVNGFTPVRDESGNLLLVRVSASGRRRQIEQGQSPAESALRRHILRSGLPPRAYWSLEDDVSATSGASAVDGVGPMLADANTNASGVVFGSDLGRVQPPYTGYEIAAVGSKPLPSLRQGGRLSAAIPAQAGTPSGYTMVFVGRANAFTGVAGSDIVLFQWLTPGASFVRWEVVNRSDDGDTDLVAYDEAGTATILANAGIRLLDLFAYRVNVLDAGGGNVQAILRITAARSTGEAGIVDFSTVAGTLAWPTFVAANATHATLDGSEIAGSENLTSDIVVGHVAFWNVGSGAPVLTVSSVDPDTGRNISPWTGWVGESATARLRRECGYENVPIEIIGNSGIEPMGFQRALSFLELIDECQVADVGLLLDGLNPGFLYVTRTSAYSLPASLTLDAALAQFNQPRPAHDDQGRINDFTASQPDGTSGQHVRTDGALGTDDVGTYNDSDTVNLADATDLVQYAAWRTNLGTNAGVRALRYPSLTMQLAKPNTALIAQDWLDLLPMRRVDAVNMNGAIPSLAQLLRGWTEHWNSKQWDVSLVLTPYDPWRVLVLAATTGDSDPFLGWLDTDDSTLATAAAIGATSLSVAINEGDLWSTAVDDFPQVVEIAGIPVTVTAIAGAASPQTFTVTGSTVTKALPAGSAVSVYHPVVLGL